MMLHRLNTHQWLNMARWPKRLMTKLYAIPSLLALLVQSSALLLVLVFGKLIYASALGASSVMGASSAMDASTISAVNPDFLIFSLVMLQASLACGLSVLFSMAVWWRWIHFFFPVALWLMSIYTLSNTVYLGGFVISLSLYWTTFKTQVPFYPSRPAVWKALHQLLQTHRQDNQSLRMIDIGSGLGDMSMYMAKVRAQDQVEGIEIAPLPWLISVVRAQLKRSRAQFKLGNYDDLNFADYDVVFAYLSPAAMSRLWQKAHHEMRTGSLLVSLEFPISDVTITQTIFPNKNSPKLYVYRIR